MSDHIQTNPDKRFVPIDGQQHYGEIVPGLNDLATRYPEVAAEADGWDPTKIGPGSKKAFKFYCRKCGLRKVQVLKERVCGYSKRLPEKAVECVGCSGFRVHVGVNDLKFKRPEIAKHARFNPEKFAHNSKKVAGFNCDRCGGTFSGVVADVVKSWDKLGRACCIRAMRAEQAKEREREELLKKEFRKNNNQKLPKVGVNDLKTLLPEIAAEAYGWDPSTVTRGARQDRQWKCPKGHTYTMRVAHRTCINKSTGKPHGCKECGHDATRVFVVSGDNDLKTAHPEVAAEIVGVDPSKIYKKALGVFRFKCPLGHIYKSRIEIQKGVGPRPWPRILKGTGTDACGVCQMNQLAVGVNDFATTNPELAKVLIGDPTKIMKTNGKRIGWVWPCGHDYELSPAYRVKMDIGPSRLCPTCDNRNGFRKTLPAYLYLLKRPGQFQFGVTNNPKSRVHTIHRRNGWKLIDFKYSLFGSSIWEAELSIKRALKLQRVPTGPNAFPEKFDGWNETFQECDLKVSSLNELFGRLSIAPPDFLAM